MSSDSAPQSLPPKTRSRVFMFLGGFLMGFVGLFVSGMGTPAHVTACLRGLFGSLFLTILLLGRKQLGQIGLVKVHWGAGILEATSNAACILFYFLTILYAGFAFGAFMLYTGGIFAVIFTRLVVKEQVYRIHYVAFALATIGVALIMEFWNGIAWNIGLLTGLLSGISLGGNTLSKKLYYKRLDQRPDLKIRFPEAPTILAWWATATLGIIFLIPSLFYFAEEPFPNVGATLLLGLVPTAIAFSCFNRGLRGDKGGDVLILSYVEPVFATLLGLAVGQMPSIFLLLGGAAILVANIIILVARH